MRILTHRCSRCPRPPLASITEMVSRLPNYSRCSPMTRPLKSGLSKLAGLTVCAAPTATARTLGSAASIPECPTIAATAASSSRSRPTRSCIRPKVGYQKWAIAVYLMTTSLKGVSSMKLHRDIGVTQKTAWHMATQDS